MGGPQKIRGKNEIRFQDQRLANTWIDSPFPDLAEPNKRNRFVTDLGDYDDAHVANLLLKASLWPIDSVFNRVRRRLSLCERPVNSSRRANQRWRNSRIP